jgi:hypothetical protein
MLAGLSSNSQPGKAAWNRRCYTETSTASPPAYDPITRQVQLSGSKNELELTLQLLSDEGILTGDDDTSLKITIDDAARDSWGTIC